MNKIVGFTLQLDTFDEEPVDFFGTGFQELRETRGRWHLRLWSIGDPAACRCENGAYSLGFPPSSDRLNRNVLIHPLPEGYRIENDWLGSIPVFYNTDAGCVSTLPGRVRADAPVDPKGAREFFAFGFAVFGQMPFCHVHFMQSHCALNLTGGRIVPEEEPDPVEAERRRPETTPDEVANSMREALSRVPGTVIVPTSGGYDSRFLNALFPAPERLRAFTYGTCHPQERSFEVRYAREICSKLNIRWEQIVQNQYFNEIPAWHRIYDSSTHLHGMYHIDFYRTIRERLKGEPATLLSGIDGDVWSGNVRLPEIDSPSQLEAIAYLHRLRIDDAFQQQPQSRLRKAFFLQNNELLQNPAWGPVVTARLKIILISYILTLPEYFGWPVWSPFLDLRVAGAMMRLPAKLRQERLWQQEFFRSRGLMPEESISGGDRSHTLDLKFAAEFHFDPLDPEVFTGLLAPGYLRRINREIARKNPLDFTIAKLQATPKIWRILDALNIAPRVEPWLNAYLVLKAFEMSCKSHNPVGRSTNSVSTGNCR